MSVSVGWPHVDRLVAAGMAVRDEDGLLWLTGAGHAAADRLFTARREGLRDLLAGWTPEQHAELAELLNTLSRVMTESYRVAARHDPVISEGGEPARRVGAGRSRRDQGGYTAGRWAGHVRAGGAGDAGSLPRPVSGSPRPDLEPDALWRGAPG